MIRIGITGGIGSGKSRVADLLRSGGVPVFDCDAEARGVVASPAMAERLLSVTGKNFFNGENLQKEVLAEYLFASGENAAKINSLIHPEVRRLYDDWCHRQEQTGCEVCAVESAILIEAGMRDGVDCLIVVDAPLQLRVERVMARDNTSRDKVLARINSQMPQSDKVGMADYVIVNDGDEKSLAGKTEAVLQAVMKNK